MLRPSRIHNLCHPRTRLATNPKGPPSGTPRRNTHTRPIHTGEGKAGTAHGVLFRMDGGGITHAPRECRAWTVGRWRCRRQRAVVERKRAQTSFHHNKNERTGLYRQRGRGEDRGGGVTPTIPPDHHLGVETPMLSPSFCRGCGVAQRERGKIVSTMTLPRVITGATSRD